MNVGTISYATQSGLGHLAKMFYDEGIINRVMITKHPRYTSHPEWYGSDGYERVNVDAFLRDLNVIVIFENAFNNWGIVDLAVRRGIKFILCPMYEWTPKPLPVKPDLVMCPSLLDVEYFKEHPHKFIPIPAARLPFKERTVAKVYLHGMGHAQHRYGKGSPEVLEAFSKYVKSDAKLIVRGQTQEPRVKQLLDKYKGIQKNITIHPGDLPYDTLFETGDIYINAEKVNGLSLPLQEAFASGMPVITTDRFPANTWLPKDMLVTPSSKSMTRLNQTDVEWCEIDPKKIAEMVDYWYDRDILHLSHEGRRWALENSWERLKSEYERVIQNVIRGLPVES